MKVGILEERNDEFANHVLAGVKDLGAEFVSFKELGFAEDPNYDVIFDRISYLNQFLREVMKKLSLNGTYVINNPFADSDANKIMEGTICRELEIPYPKTIFLPMRDENTPLENVLEPDFERIIKEIDLPCIIKPFNGYAWDNVFRVNSISELKNLYASLKSKTVLLVQEFIQPSDYYRVYTVGMEEVLFVKYDPKPAGMGKYIYSDLKSIEGQLKKMTKWNLELNKALGFDFNAVEWCMDESGKPFVIDAYNEIPEIIKGMMPQEYYDWIVSKVCELIRGKCSGDQTNKTVFRI